MILTSGLIMATTMAPVPEWIDTIAAILLLTGLAICGVQLLWPVAVRSDTAAPSAAPVRS